jgi:hypothetical protein
MDYIVQPRDMESFLEDGWLMLLIHATWPEAFYCKRKKKVFIFLKLIAFWYIFFVILYVELFVDFFFWGEEV